MSGSAETAHDMTSCDTTHRAAWARLHKLEQTGSERIEPVIGALRPQQTVLIDSKTPVRFIKGLFVLVAQINTFLQTYLHTQTTLGQRQSHSPQLRSPPAAGLTVSVVPFSN